MPVRDGEIVAAAEEERFSRIKHDYGLPKLAIKFCLEQAGIEGADLDYVVFFEKPFRKFDRILMTTLQTYPQSWKVFRESMISWMLDKMWVSTTLQSELGVPKDKVLFCDHHLSHAASAFLFALRGSGDSHRGRSRRVGHRHLWSRSRHGYKAAEADGISALRWACSTAPSLPSLALKSMKGEYKVMGMAPYGQPRYVDKVWKLVQPEPGWLVRFEHGLLLLPPLDGPDLQAEV